MTITIDHVYERLEEKMLSYRDYADIPVIPEEDWAAFRTVTPSDVLNVSHVNGDMRPFTGDDIYVRDSVLDRLCWAGRELQNIDDRFQLEIVYGFRTLDVQRRLFHEARESLADLYDDDEEALIEAAHRRIAVPDVAGHPTGGAVDVHILCAGEPLDMGTSIWNFSRDAFTFSPFIDRAAWENRQLLRRAMMSAGFAPFDGEWWHFSYGDKEWARYYRRPGALFDQVGCEAVRAGRYAGIVVGRPAS
jgi:D-alanyl-D-alanine dipeptidase